MRANLTAREAAPIHQWVLFVLVALCLVFALYPFAPAAQQTAEEQVPARVASYQTVQPKQSALPEPERP